MRWQFFPALQFSVSAGDDIYAIFTGDPIVVRGATSNARRVRWTQVSGAPVRILNANTLTPTIEPGPDYFTTEPLTLRLSVAGRPKIFDEVQIRDRLTSTGSVPTAALSLNSAGPGLETTRIIRYGGFNQPPTLLEQAYIIGDDDRYYLSWVPPAAHAADVIGYKLQRNIDGAYRTVRQYGLDPTTWYYPTELGIHYQVVALFEFGQNVTEVGGIVYRAENKLLAPGFSLLADEVTPGPSASGQSLASVVPLTFNIELGLETASDDMSSPSASSQVVASEALLTWYATTTNIDNADTADDASSPSSSSLSSASVVPLAWNATGLII